MTPTIPPKPPLPEKSPAGNSWLVIMIVVVFGALGYAVLTFLTLNIFGPVLVVVGVIALLGMFHYLTWGWWLGPYLRKISEDASEDDELAA